MNPNIASLPTYPERPGVFVSTKGDDGDWYLSKGQVCIKITQDEMKNEYGSGFWKIPGGWNILHGKIIPKPYTIQECVIDRNCCRLCCGLKKKTNRLSLFSDFIDRKCPCGFTLVELCQKAEDTKPFTCDIISTAIEVGHDFSNFRYNRSRIYSDDMIVLRRALQQTNVMKFLNETAGTSADPVLSSGSANGIKLLLKCGSDVNSQSYFNETLLENIMSSSSYMDWGPFMKQYKDKILILLKRGATTDSENMSRYLSRSPVEVLSFMFKNGVDIHDRALLHRMARRNSYEDKVRFLLRMGVDINERNSIGATPLHGMAWNKKPGMLQFFIDNGADINAQDNRGNTPLHWACSRVTDKHYPRLSVVQEFLCVGCDHTIVNNDGKTPLQLLPSELKEALKLTLTKGAM